MLILIEGECVWFGLKFGCDVVCCVMMFWMFGFGVVDLDVMIFDSFYCNVGCWCWLIVLEVVVVGGFLVEYFDFVDLVEYVI